MTRVESVWSVFNSPTNPIGKEPQARILANRKEKAPADAHRLLSFSHFNNFLNVQ